MAMDARHFYSIFGYIQKQLNQLVRRDMFFLCRTTNCRIQGGQKVSPY